MCPNTYCRVLVTFGDLPFRQVQDGECKVYSRDGSFIRFIVEELIIRSASKVVFNFPSNWFVEAIPASFNDRVDWICMTSVAQKSYSFLSPLLDEFGVEIPSDGVYSLEPKHDHNIQKCVMNIVEYTKSFLIGIEESLQLEIDLDDYVRSLMIVRESSKDPEARSRIAILLGITSNYKKCNVPGLVALPEAKEDIIEHFNRLVIDAEYQSLSESAYGIGRINNLVQHRLQMIGRKIRDLMEDRKFKALYNHGTTVANVATGISLPDSEAAESFLTRKFLPPIISLKEPFIQALEIWKKTKPEMIPSKFKKKEQKI